MSYNEQPQATAGSKIWKGFATIVFIAQAAASVIVFVKAFMLGMIPDKYLYGMGIVLWLLLMINALMLFVGSKRPVTGGKVLRRFIAVILAICICFGSVLAYQAIDRVKAALGEVTTQVSSDDTPVAMMNLYVLATDPAKTVADCKGYTVGIAAGNDSRNSKAALNKMSAETGTPVQSKEYGSEGELISALYGGDTKAIIISSTQAEILSETEEYQGFVDKCRMVREYEITNADLAFIPADPNASEGNSGSMNDNNAVNGDITKTPFILYISGSDTRNKQFKTSRSDVNILMVVNPKTKQILLVNTPRDYYIPNPKSKKGERDKLTHLGLYGVGCSMKGLGDLYGCTVNYSVQINFTGLQTLVDQLGGVTIDNPQAFTAENGIKFKKGTITLNGEQALAYARERHAFSSGDNMRGQNQMRIITAMVNKVTSNKSQILKNYAGIMSALSGMFKTSVPTSEIEKLVKMQLNDMSQWKISSYAVTGKNGSEKTYTSPGHKAYVMWPDEKAVSTGSEKIRKVVSGEPL